MVTPEDNETQIDTLLDRFAVMQKRLDALEGSNEELREVIIDGEEMKQPEPDEEEWQSLRNHYMDGNKNDFNALEEACQDLAKCRKRADNILKSDTGLRDQIKLLKEQLSVSKLKENLVYAAPLLNEETESDPEKAIVCMECDQTYYPSRGHCHKNPPYGGAGGGGRD